MSAIPAFVFCLCFLLGQSSVGLAADFTGPVVAVLDGDTIEVLHKTHAERIRLNGIDCHAMRAPRNVVDSTRRG